jgi:hypothetical protein
MKKWIEYYSKKRNWTEQETETMVKYSEQGCKIPECYANTLNELYSTSKVKCFNNKDKDYDGFTITTKHCAFDISVHSAGSWFSGKSISELKRDINFINTIADELNKFDNLQINYYYGNPKIEQMKTIIDTHEHDFEGAICYLFKIENAIIETLL